MYVLPVACFEFGSLVWQVETLSTSILLGQLPIELLNGRKIMLYDHEELCGGLKINEIIILLLYRFCILYKII